MKKLIIAIALLTPGAFAVAQDNPQEPRIRQNHYGDVIDVDKMILEDVTQITVPGNYPLARCDSALYQPHPFHG